MGQNEELAVVVDAGALIHLDELQCLDLLADLAPLSRRCTSRRSVLRFFQCPGAIPTISWSRDDMPTLTAKEKAVLQAFKARAMEAFPGEVLQVQVFGSKARGTAGDQSDIDLLVVTKSGDWRTGDAIRRIGYELDADIDYKLSIQVLPAAHMRYLAENRFSFYRDLSRDGVTV